MARALPAGGPFDLVDIGAGAGFAGEYLRTSRPEARYFFIEPIATLERRLEERFGPDRNLREAASLAGMSCALLMDVLEHQRDDRAFIGEILDKMDAGSRLFVTVPAGPSLWSEWDVLLGHFRRYTRVSLRAVVDERPVAVEELSYVFPELIPLAFWRRLQSRPGASHGGEFPDLPAWVNETLYWSGRLTLPMRSMWPAGTSLYMRLRKL